MTSAAGSRPLYRVVVFAAPDDPGELSEVFESALGMHATDAIVHARSAPGVLSLSLPKEQADQIAAGIGAIGLGAEVVAEADLPDLVRPTVVHHAACLEDGLEIMELHGRESALIAWDDVDLLSIGQIPKESSRHYPANDVTTVKSGRRTGPSTLETPLSPGPEAWILCARPFRVYRIDHKRMNYEYLGARKIDSATANFRLFIDDIVARARRAYLTPATRAYVEHGSVADYSFQTADELQRDTILHLLVHRRIGDAPTVT